MTHPVIMKHCVCGGTWDTHGIYSFCPRCAKPVTQSRDATGDEIAAYNAMVEKWRTDAIADVAAKNGEYDL